MAGLFFLLFVYNVLVWRGVIGDGTAWRPLQTVFLSGALLTQAIASLIGARSRVAFYALLGASMVLLYFGVFTR